MAKSQRRVVMDKLSSSGGSKGNFTSDYKRNFGLGLCFPMRPNDRGLKCLGTKSHYHDNLRALENRSKRIP